MSDIKNEEKLAIPEDVAKQVKENLKRVNEEKDQPTKAKVGVPRTKQSGGRATAELPNHETMPMPGELDPDGFGPTAFAATIHGPITGDQESQEFILDADRLENLHFSRPGLNLPKKRLYTVKAFKPNGALVQLPFEPQIQNSAGGDPLDAIGLHRYVRKGFKLLFSFETMQPIYCAAWGCWAKADGKTGFCSPRHAVFTLPNQYSGAGEIVQGLLSKGATTTRTWES